MSKEINLTELHIGNGAVYYLKESVDKYISDQQDIINHLEKSRIRFENNAIFHLKENAKLKEENKLLREQKK